MGVCAVVYFNRLAGNPMPHNQRLHVDSHELRGLIEQAPDAYFLHDYSGRFIDVNRRACESLGYTREELLQLSVFDIEIDFDIVSAQSAWSLIEAGQCTTLMGRQRRKDGSVFPVEARLSPCFVGKEKLCLGLVRDLTDRKSAEEALRVSAEQYQTLFNSIDEGFCVVEILFDAQGKPDDYKFVEVNPAFEKHVGLIGAPGRTIRQLVPAIENKWIDIYGQVALTGQSVRFREYSPSLQGRSFDVYAFRFGEEGSVRVAILFANVTERVAAEEALKKTEQLALIGRMAGVISHEINNPLDAIQNLLYMAEFEQDPAMMREHLRKAQEEVSSATRIVSQTLNFTRRSEHAREEKLSQIFDSALTLLDGKSKRIGISVERLYRTEAAVPCLSSELRQVFANLLSNSFDAVPAGGRVAVRIRDSMHWESGRAGVRITLADNGCGMTTETQHRLFEAFYTTKGSEGTGLGLWVSRDILWRHGVQVRLKSRSGSSGSGTVFMLWFPRNHEPISTAEQGIRGVSDLMSAHSSS